MVILHKINYSVRNLQEMNTFFLPENNKNCTLSKKVRIETYGCQMNVADSEVVATMMGMAGYSLTEDDSMAAAVLFGGIYGIYLLAAKKKERKDHFAFGPFLCLGMVLGLLCGQPLIDWYLGMLVY